MTENLPTAAPLSGPAVVPHAPDPLFVGVAPTAPEFSQAEKNTLAFALDQSDPDFSLSVPAVTKGVLKKLLAIIEKQQEQLAQSAALDQVARTVINSAQSCVRSAGDPDRDPDGYNAGFEDATIGAARKLQAALGE